MKKTYKINWYKIFYKFNLNISNLNQNEKNNYVVCIFNQKFL